MSNDTELEQLTRELNKLQLSVVGKDGETAPLRRAWHYLQVYATWGVKLPADENILKLTLGIKNPGEFDFFLPMLDGYNKLSATCENFLKQVFSEVIDVGQNAKQFAKDAGGKDDGIFSAVTELVDAGDEESLQAVVHADMGASLQLSPSSIIRMVLECISSQVINTLAITIKLGRLTIIIHNRLICGGT